MNVDSFFRHWGIRENPFKAEEARDDPVYRRIMLESQMTHPDFEKIFGSPDHPSTSVVFGEKGSGKTAIRLLIEERLGQHNAGHPDSKAWIARYDDLNAMIDNVVRRTGKSDPGEALKEITLYDHMDAILSLVTTRALDFLLGEDLELDRARKRRRQIRRMAYQKRLDLAVLGMLYDQHRTGNPMSRWNQTLTRLRVGRVFSLRSAYWLCVLLLLAALGAIAAGGLRPELSTSLYIGGAAGIVAALGGLYAWSRQAIKARKVARRIEQEVRVIERPRGTLKMQLGDLPLAQLQPMPLPMPGSEDSRYELFARLKQILAELGYASICVLMDRVDEPALVNGQPGRMRSLIWPMLNNKFLQQDGVGFKLLLPIELGHLLRKEDEDFYQKARLDKQNMIERLAWSGSTLYDICTRRLQGCLDSATQQLRLTDLFEAGVERHDIVEALDQMDQPRDAFKFLYRVIQEHCHNSSDENPEWHIPKAVLDQVRKRESQRVQDLYRGLTPA